METPKEDLKWRKSKRCSDGECVEVAEIPEGGMAVRNSTDTKNQLEFEAEDWKEFIGKLRRRKVGRFAASDVL